MHHNISLLKLTHEGYSTIFFMYNCFILSIIFWTIYYNKSKCNGNSFIFKHDRMIRYNLDNVFLTLRAKSCNTKRGRRNKM